jgi:hypothetical protein
MSDTPPTIDEAQAEVAKAAADLSAAEAQQPVPEVAPVPQPAPEPTPPATGGEVDPAAVPPPAGESMMRLCVPIPWHVFVPGGDLPTVTFDGIDVSATIADEILAAAAAENVELRKVDNA